MRDWLERPGEPASDLDLVVLLLNSLDLLEDPSDRLTDLTWLGEVLAAVGRDDIGGALTAGDLAGLRQLRESLRAVFQAGSPEGSVKAAKENGLRMLMSRVKASGEVCGTAPG